MEGKQKEAARLHFKHLRPLGARHALNPLQKASASIRASWNFRRRLRLLHMLWQSLVCHCDDPMPSVPIIRSKWSMNESQSLSAVAVRLPHKYSAKQHSMRKAERTLQGSLQARITKNMEKSPDLTKGPCPKGQRPTLCVSWGVLFRFKSNAERHPPLPPRASSTSSRKSSRH